MECIGGSCLNVYKEGIPAADIPFILTDVSNLRFSQRFRVYPKVLGFKI